ncbi:hypothetical protein P691DRAFT_723992 [Macrolepiota fuliginosa MF-IS2]|uniref:F-box domain-containing protein n=1 Tax=Macrolepiota fuliginosa MF-IS2 TaxID=1400762 RepID=A0A9P6C7V7_9AGAR|nr:hypothetical protein P691DRAFT_723992 [Macrolepiota fuliginosa MF-IS2]
MFPSGVTDAQTPLMTINSLPPELLSSIFLHLWQVRRHQQLLPFQVTISRVCRHWRQIAISTPTLWSTITLFSSASLPCVDEWLARSGATPLDVRLDIYDADYRGDVDAVWIEKVLASVASNVHRFRNLLVFTYQEVNLYHILQLFQHVEAPLMETLRVYTGRYDAGNNPTPPTAFNGGLPKLAIAAFEPLQCLPPLTSITTLHLNVVGRETRLRFDRLVEILQMPQGLITLSLRGPIDNQGYPVQRDRSHVQLPKLRNLELSSQGATGVWFILFFSTPNLESLRWDVNSDNYHQLLNSSQFHTGTVKFPSLRYLTLINQRLSTHHLENMMLIFPAATHVLFSHPLTPGWNRHQHLDVLRDSRGWPNLEVLAFQKLFPPGGKPLALELLEIIPERPNIKRILVDGELLLRLDENAPDLRNLVGLEELNCRTFPDYWWISRQQEALDRL